MISSERTHELAIGLNLAICLSTALGALALRLGVLHKVG